MCPVCAVAVGFGLGLSRWLKIDDAISGLWIGALLVSLSFLLAKKKIKIAGIYFIVLILMTFIPLNYYHVIGNPLNTYRGMDKLAFGTTVGVVVFLFSLFLHGFLKYRHHNKVYFPFQKVVIPIDMLLLASFVMYGVVKYAR